MERKLTILLLVSTAVGARCGRHNIFGLEFRDEIPLAELEQQLSPEQAPGLEEVARLLFWARDKNQTIQGVKIRDLVYLAGMDSPVSLKNCRRSKMRKFERFCRKVAENVHLFGYCKYCIARHREHCANFSEVKLFDHLVSTMPVGGALLYYTNAVSDYKRDHERGLETPEEKSVGDYLATLDAEELQEYKSACVEFQQSLREDLFHFDEGGRRTFKHLEEVEPEKNLLRTRCELIQKLVH